MKAKNSPLAEGRRIGPWATSTLGFLLVTQLAACDVGRSLLAPIDDVPDATVTPTDVTGDGTLTPDVSAGTRTCADFADCAGSCADGAGFGDCLMGCARDLRASSRPLVDDVLTCVRANCDAGLSTMCAGVAVTGPCAARATACRADTARPDGGLDAGPDVPAVDAPIDAGPDVPAVDAPIDAVIPADLPVGGLGCIDGVQHCVPSCPERDVDCMRRCASGMRAGSMTLFNNLITCLTGACGSLSSYICFQAAADVSCPAQIAACMADAPGTPPTPVCGAPMSQAGESSCGGMCVNTSYRNNANCGLCGAACAASQTCSFGACVPHGVANIALQWDGIGDVDLVVRTPCGNVVSARQPANCGATFDRSNSAGIGPESISFAATPMTGRYTVCAIPRTTIRGTRPGSRVLLDRTGMPLMMFPPVPMGAATDRLGGEFRVLETTPDTTTDDCPATSPFRVADIDL